ARLPSMSALSRPPLRRPTPTSPPFPYTTLFRSAYVGLDNRAAGRTAGLLLGRFIGPRTGKVAMIAGSRHYRGHEEREMGFHHILDRKSTRLNSSHVKITYAVFYLKKKKRPRARP